MKPYFTHHVVTWILFVSTIAVWVVGELNQSVRTREGAKAVERQSGRTLRLFLVAGFVGATLLQSKVPSARFAGGAVTFSLGLVITWLGIGLRFWAFRTLGEYFTFTLMTSPDQEVVARGPYRMLRHPSYAGLSLVLIGLGVLYGNWLSVAALTVLPMAGIIYRIRVEEQALFSELGDAYRSFAAGRKRLVPFVW